MNNYATTTHASYAASSSRLAISLQYCAALHKCTAGVIAVMICMMKLLRYCQAYVAYVRSGSARLVALVIPGGPK